MLPALQSRDRGLRDTEPLSQLLLRDASGPSCANQGQGSLEPRRLFVVRCTELGVPGTLVRDELAEEFGLPLHRVRVIADAIGGGFGSKSSLGNYGRIAVELSRRANAPVKLFLEREEEQIDAGNRPGTWQRLRIGAKRDGTLTAISLESYGTAGVGLGAGVGNNAETLYSCANFEGAQHDVFVNAGPGCAMRGPGGGASNDRS